MIVTATKTAIVEALRGLFDEDFETFESPDAVRPRKVSVEYAEEEQDWPFILVQVRLDSVGWTGINPDEWYEAEDPDDPTKPMRHLRRGVFSGACDLQILATTSHERDRIWDSVSKILLIGTKHPTTKRFFDTLENHDLVGITVQKGSIPQGGDTISPGVPWNEEVLAYEATVGFNLIGEFFADEFTEEIVPLSAVKVTEYTDEEEPPGEGDGQGSWREW